MLTCAKSTPIWQLKSQKLITAKTVALLHGHSSWRMEVNLWPPRGPQFLPSMASRRLSFNLWLEALKTVALSPPTRPNLWHKALQNCGRTRSYKLTTEALRKAEATCRSGRADAQPAPAADPIFDSIREQRRAEEQRTNEFRWKAEEYLENHPEFDAGAVTLMEFVPGLKMTSARTVIKNHRKKKSRTSGRNGSHLQY